jgi:DNA-binding MarR family transcriptional regulator
MSPDAATPNPSRRPWGMVLKHAEQSMLRAKSQALRPAGLTVAQYVALDALKINPGITAASLARACLVTPQAIMIVLKAMDEQGLIARTPHPRHPNVLELSLTDVGREALDNGRELVAPIERRLDNVISSEDARVLTQLLDRVIDVTGRE